MTARFSSQDKAWGLYHKDAQAAIPLKSLHASISILNTISRVKYTQNYFNDSDKVIETEFFFPISSDACFDSFEATFNDTTIRGVIKKKEQAKEEYKEAIAQGRTAAYTEINEETGDIMKVMIGNIPPNTPITITYSYIQKLEIAANKFLCFRLFSTITPRYNGNLQDALKADITLLSSYPTVSSQDPQAYPWTVEAEIQSPSPITFVKSPSHDIAPVYGNENHTCSVTFKSNAPEYPNKDFILLYTNNENKKDQIDYMMTPFEEGYCAMVNVRADFQKASNEKVYENLVKAKEIENEISMDEVRGEYIFLIDRSGSMSGDRITMARESLILFLKSLPQNSLFNVVSFGSSYRFLFDGSSQKYNQDTLEQAVKQIATFEADLGGTEIYRALEIIFNDPIKADYPRSIFLLTDGGVSNTHQVLQLIEKNSTRAKTYTIGIGNGCSQELITQGALRGRGKHEFVANNSEIYEKVISLLNASLSPCYSDISFESDNFDAVVKALTPNPSTIPLLLDGQTITFFLFLRREAFANNNKMVLKLNMNDSRAQKRRTIEISLDTDEAIQNELIPKLAVHDMIRRLETDKMDVIWMPKEDIQNTLVELSLKYGVLCKQTAFLCEMEKSNVKALQDTQKIKIVVPTIRSQDLESAYQHQRNSIDSLMTGFKFSFERMENLAELSRQCEVVESKSMSFKKKSSSGGVFKSISNAFGSLFGSKKSPVLTPQPQPPSKTSLSSAPQASYQQQKQQLQAKADFCADSYDEECEDDMAEVQLSSLEYKEEKKADKHNLKEAASVDDRCIPERLVEDGVLPTLGSKPTTNSNSSLYLQVIMKQQFEGCWDPQESFISQTILKSGTLTEAPEEIKNIDAALAQTIWLTILVLLWLEVSCQSDRKAWLLIYQKGINWLKNKGVNYEDTKSLGTSQVRI